MLNALLSEYKFKNINIELARDFCLGKKKKKKLEDRQNEYRKKNEEAIAEGFSSKRLQKKFRI